MDSLSIIIKFVHRGSFGDLSNKQQYFHIEPIERHSDSVSFCSNSHNSTLYSGPSWIHSVSLSLIHTHSLSHSFSPTLSLFSFPSFLDPPILSYPSLISWKHLMLFIWQLNITSVGEIAVNMSVV